MTSPWPTIHSHHLFLNKHNNNIISYSGQGYWDEQPSEELNEQPSEELAKSLGSNRAPKATLICYRLLYYLNLLVWPLQTHKNFFVSKFPRPPKWSKNWKFPNLPQMLGNSFYSSVPPTVEMIDRRLGVIGSSPSHRRIIVQTCLENTQETRMCWIVSSAWSHRETHQIQHLFSCGNIFTLGWFWKDNFAYPLFLPFPESITGAKA